MVIRVPILNSKNQDKFIPKVIKNPVAEYEKLHSKIKYNPLTSIADFKYTVDYLIEEINHPFVVSLYKLDKKNKENGVMFAGALAEQYEKSLINLSHINLKFELNQKEIDDGYPHRPLVDGPYPYQPTLSAIMSVLSFFENLRRITQDDIPPIYHTDRYTHYELSLRHHKDAIIVPSNYPLSIKSLISLRAAPIFLTGVSANTTFADGYFNTPIDFYTHDANHNRRFLSYNNQYFRKHNITSDEDKINTYKYFQEIIQSKIFPTIAINKNMSSEEIELRKMKKILYFEMLHEYAFTPDKDTIIEAFKFRQGNQSPFEIMYKPTEEALSKADESRRLPNNNIQSGTLNFILSKENGNQKMSTEASTVKYYLDVIVPNFMTSCFNKLTHSFYDNKFMLIQDIPDLKHRTPELLAKAALSIIEDYGIKNEEVGLSSDKQQSLNEIILLANNVDKDGNEVGKIEKYADKNLKKPRLKENVGISVMDMKRQELEADGYKSNLTVLKKGSIDDSSLRI